MMRVKFTITVCIALMAITCLGLPQVAGAQVWQTQILDKNLYGSISIAIDSNDNPHIVYEAYDSSIDSHGVLMYSVWNGANWDTERIGEGRGTVSLALDATGNPHIIFNNQSKLVYAYFDGTNWHFRTVDKEGFTASLSLNSDGNPCIAYIGDLQKTLKYASWDGVKWNIQTIQTVGYNQFLVYRVSLVLDANDKPHILYGFNTDTHGYNATVKYAVLGNSGWDITTAVTGIPDNFGNLALDFNGKPYFTYVKNYPSNTNLNATLVLTNLDNHTWSDQVIASGIDRLFGVAYLALDSENQPQVTFYNESLDLTHSTLMYAKFANNAWDIEPIPNSDATQSGPIAVDSHGKPHIIYVLRNSQEIHSVLMYATIGSSGQISVVSLYQLLIIVASVTVIAIISILFYRLKRKRL